MQDVEDEMKVSVSTVRRSFRRTLDVLVALLCFVLQKYAISQVHIHVEIPVGSVCKTLGIWECKVSIAVMVTKDHDDHLLRDKRVWLCCTTVSLHPLPVPIQ